MGKIDRSVLMPPAFKAGLDRWSPTDGDPAGASLGDSPDARVVLDDVRFGGCLELCLQSPTTRIRWMGETPLLPDRIVRIRLRARLVSGDPPVMRIAGTPGGLAGRLLVGLPEAGGAVLLNTRRVRGVAATAAPSEPRRGIDMAWGHEALWGHFGFDVLGVRGAVVRIEQLQIELLPQSLDEAR